MVTVFDRRYSKRVSRPIAPTEKFVLDDKNIPVSIVDSPLLREDGSVSELDVDQFSGQEFMLNPNGFITNDIMMFEECQSDSVARSILQRLKVLHPQAIDQNLSVDGMLAMSVPSNYGSPAEFVSANRTVAKKVYDLYQSEVSAHQAASVRQSSEVVRDEVSDLSKSVPNPE